MKKQILTVIAIVLAIGVNSTAFGQDNMNLQKSKTKSNQSNEKSATSPHEVCKVKIRTTPTGCEIVFTNELVSPRDAASGIASGKDSTNSPDNQRITT